jgi:menaquinol-cytochrome c reductase iron-sulfur subunit
MQNEQERQHPPGEQRRLLNRRQFLSRIGLLMGGIGAVVVGGPFIGFLGARRPLETGVWRAVGALDEFPIGLTRTVAFADPGALPWAGFAAGEAAFVRRESDTDFVAFSVYCTHVGCPVRWEEGAQLFMCPCHGGVFHRNGDAAAGPPTRPLGRFPVRVRNGEVEVMTAPFPLPPRTEANG